MIQRIIEIPLSEIRSEHYETNINSFGDNSNTCFICGKPIKDMTTSKHIHLLTNGNIVSSDQPFVENEDQGFFPVGRDCSKKLVINFTFKIL